MGKARFRPGKRAGCAHSVRTLDSLLLQRIRRASLSLKITPDVQLVFTSLWRLWHPRPWQGISAASTEKAMAGAFWPKKRSQTASHGLFGAFDDLALRSKTNATVPATDLTRFLARLLLDEKGQRGDGGLGVGSLGKKAAVLQKECCVGSPGSIVL